MTCDTVDSTTIEDTDEAIDTENTTDHTVTTISTKDTYLSASLSLDADTLFLEVLVRNTDGDDLNLTNSDSVVLNVGAEDITLEKRL